MKFIYILFFLLSIKIYSSPWFEVDDHEAINNIKKIEVYCGIESDPYLSSPISLSIIHNLIIQSLENKSKKCATARKEIEDFLISRYAKKETIIGISSGADDLYFQERGTRIYNQKNYYLSHESVQGKLAYKIKATSTKNDLFFDESYISYLYANNYVFKLGKVNKWWSPSNSHSLILSNSARPFPSISLSNYGLIPNKSRFFKFIDSFDFDVFIGKLERKRAIPNALLFGNRITFKSKQKAYFSIYRVAQYGGKGRSLNSETLKRMISGKDTTNSNFTFEEQSGNQIAGIDFLYQLNFIPSLVVYGQYFGEDGLDPIIDDRWIGAIFPSKRFGSAGITYSNKSLSNPWKLSLEHIDTDTGYENVTYNHDLYKSGYRYKGLPIGAIIDTDSHMSLINLQNDYLKIQYSKFDLNQNKSEFSRWGDEKIQGEELSIKYKKNLTKNIFLDISYHIRNVDKNEFNKNLFFIKVEQRI